jgi:hypothetical protein
MFSARKPPKNSRGDGWSAALDQRPGRSRGSVSVSIADISSNVVRSTAATADPKLFPEPSLQEVLGHAPTR